MTDCRYYDMCGLLKVLPQQECPGAERCKHYAPMPDVVREEIVRCRDCEYFDPGAPIPGCTLLDFGVTGQAEEGFCAWGEPR